MHSYRTTFSASPLVANAIRDRARKEGKSISSVVNEMLQSVIDGKRSNASGREPFKVKPFSLHMKPEIDASGLKELLTELDIEDYKNS